MSFTPGVMPRVPVDASRPQMAVKSLSEEKRSPTLHQPGKNPLRPESSGEGQEVRVVKPCPASSAHVARIVRSTAN
jgi:hypothetical protein